MRLFTKTLIALGLLAIAAAPGYAYEKGTVVLRAGVATVDPKTNNYTMSEDTPTGTFSVFVDVRSATSMTLTGTYMFNEHWAADLLVAMPFKHDVDAYVQVPDPVPDQPPTVYQGKVADTKQLPLTLSLQYHFSPSTDLQPYIGVGANWTSFSSTRLTGLLEDVVGDPIDKLMFDDSYGLALQAGGDWAIGNRVVLNFDVRWLDIDTDVSVAGPNFPEDVKLFKAEIDPFVWSLNIGFHF